MHGVSNFFSRARPPGPVSSPFPIFSRFNPSCLPFSPSPPPPFYDIGATLVRVIFSARISRLREDGANTCGKGVDASAKISKLENLGKFTAAKSGHGKGKEGRGRGKIVFSSYDRVRRRTMNRKDETRGTQVSQPLGTDHWKSWSRKASHGREG